MSIQTAETAAIKDIDAVLAKLAVDLDKVRKVSDQIETAVAGVDRNFFVSMAEKLPGVSPVVDLVVQIAAGLDALIDAVDDISDGLQSTTGKSLPAVPQAAAWAGGSVAAT